MKREEAIRLMGWLKCTTNREDDTEAIDMIYQQDDTTFIVEGHKEFVEAVTHLAKTIDKNIEIDIRSTGIAFEFDACRYNKNIVELLMKREQCRGAMTRGDTK